MAPSGHRPAPPVGTARVAISGHGDAGNPWVNVFWLDITATTHTAADLGNVVDSMVAAYALHFKAYKIVADAQTGAKASWLYASGNSIEYAASYSNAGTLAGQFSTDANCYVINWSISDYYRGGHPRTYLSGVGYNNITNARLVAPGIQSSLAADAISFMNATNALTHGGISAVTLGTVRFASGNAWLSPPVFRAYQSASVRPVLGTQRRRFAAY